MLTPYRAPRARKGVAFIWFALLTLPIVLFFCALTIDAGRIYIVSRQVGNLAQASALAGAQDPLQYNEIFGPEFSVKDRAHADSVIQATFSRGYQTGAIPGVISMPAVTTEWDMYTAQVRVYAEYQVKGLIFARMWGLTNNTWFGSGAAFVCIPADETSPTQGYCTRTGI